MKKHRLLLLVIVLLASSSQAADSGDAAYQKSLEKWKAELVDDLKENWLILAGLFWLNPGDNTFGSDKSNAVVFPKGPAHAGSFVFHDAEVTVKFLPGISAKIDGKRATSGVLQPDTSGKTTVVELGSLQMHVIKRGQRVGIRLKDVNSTAVRTYPGPVFYLVNLKYRVTATWVPSDGKKTIDVPNVLGDTTPTPITGQARFKINGQDLSLTDLGGEAGGGLFFVFNDPTSRIETYPGGRFLKTDPVKDGTVVLDFNRAYNPPCAVTPFATCPLAPKENRLVVSVPAGEKYDHQHAQH
jgi:uncharacterized protein (DUF1684 family)